MPVIMADSFCCGEDTDLERSTPEAVQNVLDAMDWLGLDVDADPLYQTTRREAHLAAAQDLLDRGLAYRSDFGKPEQGECTVFRMPGQDMSFTDLVKGEMAKKADDMKDLVIVRSDGSPVFHLANVLDDIEMGITHVIRGDDHVENTFRHIALYEAFGAEVPQFGHLPMIVNQAGKPYSKRDGDAYVGDFKANGYLSEALFNYLVLLGWSPGDDREVIPKTDLVRDFDLGRVQHSPAQVDLRKLDWMNGEYLREMDSAAYLALFTAALQDGGASVDDTALVAGAAGLLQSRLKKLTDAPTAAAFVFGDDYPVDEKNWRKRFGKEGAAETLAGVREAFAAVDEFTSEKVHTAMHAFMDARELGPGQVMPLVRLAATGQAGGAELPDLLALLGSERVLARMDRALAEIG